MNIQNPLNTPLKLDARGWGEVLKKYRTPKDLRALMEMLVTFIPFLALWIAMYNLIETSLFLVFLLAIPAGAFLVRIFIIQHDCGHGSFFKTEAANRWVGRILGIATLTPFDLWKRKHAIHHAGSGSLDHRGIGDITTLTVEEYKARKRMGRILYRLYRNPIIMFVIGPAYVFLLEHRLPFGDMKNGWMPWLSTLSTNAGIAVAASLLIWQLGLFNFLIIQVPVTLVAASLGVWLFFIQHQFEDTVWDRRPAWDRREAALHGSSHYDLPPVLRWLSGNIGIHHVHHLCSQIPYYRLPTILKDYPELKDISRITLWQSIKCSRLALWDTESYRLLSFKEAKAAIATARA